MRNSLFQRASVQRRTKIYNQFTLPNKFCNFLYTFLFFPLPGLRKSKKDIDRGQILKNAVDASRLSKELVARKAGYTRTSYYKHIEDPDLPFHILAAYGKAIHHDFIEEIVDMPKYIIDDPTEGYDKEMTLPEALKQIDYWKGKYIELLEKYNRLIEENIIEKMSKK